MRGFAARLAFVHRTLWQRDPAYRWAVLLGPPPLAGGAVAALAWAVAQHIMPSTPAPGVDAPWARWERPAPLDSQSFAEAPTAALPQTDASGRYVGYRPGWQGEIHPITVDATMDANVLASALTAFTFDQSSLPMTTILNAGPPSGLFVGTARAFFVAQTPGVYAFSVRFTRSSPQTANCLVRFVVAGHRMVRNIMLNMNGQAVSNFPATEFQLSPGLLRLEAAVGCWRGDQVVGPGELTVIVRHPGEPAPKPVTPDEVIRPVSRGSNVGESSAPQSR